jgi:hypothetical protein
VANGVGISLTADSEEVLTWLNGWSTTLVRELSIGAKQVGGIAANQAYGKTQQRGAVGASRGYLEGWAYELDSPASVTGVLYNSARHAEFAEYGRKPGKMPSSDFIEEWMEFKGIDLKLSYVIRRSIGRKGTKGYQILAAIWEEDRDFVYQLLDDYIGRALAIL